MSEQELNTWLSTYIITPVSWLVIVFAVVYFSWKLIAWLWRLEWIKECVNTFFAATSSYVTNERTEIPQARERGAAFTNIGTDGSSAFTRPGTTRTADNENEPAVQAEPELDLSAIVASLERRGYLCLTPGEQEIARQVVYQVERHARLNPASPRSKTTAIERATGQKRGGSAEYKRASTIYDAVVGKPDPAVVAPSIAQQDAVNA